MKPSFGTWSGAPPASVQAADDRLRAPHALRALAAVAAGAIGAMAVAATAACADPRACEDIADRLKLCDVVPASGACEQAWPGHAEALLARIDSDGCAALRERDGVVRDEACAVLGWPCPPALHGEGKTAPRHPIVFVGGIDGVPAFSFSARVLEEVGTRTGAVVFGVDLPAWEDTATRATSLHDQLVGLAARAPQGPDDARFHLICYAVGGIDCRFLASPEGLFATDPIAHDDAIALIASITTIATPHRGTNVADFLLALPPSQFTDTLTATLLAGQHLDAETREAKIRAALRGITLDEARDRDLAWSDDPRVLAQSWAGVSEIPDAPSASDDEIERWCFTSDGAPGFARHPGTRDRLSDVLWPVAPTAEVAAAGGVRAYSPADGIVAVESARWGRFRGCIPADHYDVIGQLQDDGLDPLTGFDAARFYADVVAELAGVEP